MPRAGVRFVKSRAARKSVELAARPQLERAGRAIGRAIVEHVPVHHGGAISTFRPQVSVAGDGVQVSGFGPFWHLLEYGTPFSPPYRPIERGARDVVDRWEAH